MTFPTPEEIKRIAQECSYEERREEASYTLYFKKQGRDKYPTLINVFYTTRGIMTKLSHPKSGYNQLWRSSAYSSVDTLKYIFNNPRKHTGKGYRTADKAKRGCILCGMLKERNEFSKNQWRKDPGDSKCMVCVQDAKSTRKDRNTNTNSGKASLSPQGSTNLPVLFLGVDTWYVDTCGDAIKGHSVVLTEETLLNDPHQAKICNVSKKYRAVVITDDWFDVDEEYQSLANNIFQVLKDMYQAGGSIVIAATIGLFSAPRQISKMFCFDTPWEFGAYTTMNMITTPLGREILRDSFPEKSVYTKANFVKTSPEECLFQEYIYLETYEDDIPSPVKDNAPVVRHCGPNGGTVFYFGFVSEDGFKWGNMMMRLMQPLPHSSSQTQSQGNAVPSAYDISYECTPCDEESCTNLGASICCSACKMVFYCSEACQRCHKCAHSNDCRVGASMRERHVMDQDPSALEKHGRAMAAMLAGRQDFQGRLLQAYYWLMEKNWGGALEIYKSLFMEAVDRSPPEQRELTMGASRCFYEMGRHDDAIKLGDSAIRMNRHFPEVHKYVALSYWAKGDMDSAILTMTKAVLYETPWDDKNIKANKILLMDLKRG